jgi:hypothetical protein
LKEKVDLAGMMMDQKLMPTDWIYDNIFHFSEDQYQEYRDLLIEDQNVYSDKTKFLKKETTLLNQAKHMVHHTP